MDKKMLKEVKIIKILVICLVALFTINTTFNVINFFKNGNTTWKESNGNGNDESTAEYDVSMFKSIDQDGFAEVLKEKKTQIVYFGRPTCSFCVQFLPVLQQAQEEFDYKTYYVNIESVDESTTNFENMINLINDQTETFNKKHDLGDQGYKSLYGLTPTVVAVKNNKIVDIWIGYADYESFVAWLTELGI